MKIVIVLDIVIGVGGGFDQAFNAIIQMRRLCLNRFDLEVFTMQKSNVMNLRKFDINAILIEFSNYEKFYTWLYKVSFFNTLRIRLGLGKRVGTLEKRLIQHRCDLVYFVTPCIDPLAIGNLNYISTLWDLCHRENPEFPEVRNNKEFLKREIIYRNNLGPALLTLTESDRLADMASKFYGIERSRFISMPMMPSPFLKSPQVIKSEEVLLRYNLKSGYFFYPAQFWAHKNHIRILESLVILRDSYSWTPNLVFSGKDQGNLKHTIQFIKDYNLESQVRIIGFVPSEHMRGLYQNAMTLIMPTYFGPTNLPPLEAWSIGVPLIYSIHLEEQAGNAALLVDPDNVDELASAMRESTKTEVRNNLIKAGYKRLAALESQRKNAEDKLSKVLKQYSVRRSNWE
jgi:glycosyltransferase involved in cell wall biosynthesis